jgi:hypothetical protein
MNLYDISLHHPLYLQMLWLIFPILLLYVFLFKWRIDRSMQLYGSFHFAERLTREKSSISGWLRVALLLTAWMLATFAMAGPRGNPRYPQKMAETEAHELFFRLPKQEIAFVMDASASMTVKDTRTGLSRFDQAKDFAKKILLKLPAGLTVSLHAFTSEEMVISAATQDYFFIRMMIDDLHINEGETSGTLFAPVVQFMKALLQKKPDQAVTFLLFSDGGDNPYEKEPAHSRKSYVETLITPLLQVNLPYELFVLGFGTEKGGNIPLIVSQGKPVKSVLEEAFLKQIADSVRGEFFAVNSTLGDTLVEEIIREIKQQTAAAQEMQHKIRSDIKDNPPIYDEYFQYPLALALLALCLSSGMAITRLVQRGQVACLALSLPLLFSSCNAPENKKKKDVESIASMLRIAAAEADLGGYSYAWARYEALSKMEEKEQLLKPVILCNKAILLGQDGQWDSAKALAMQGLAVLPENTSEQPVLYLQQKLYGIFAFFSLQQASLLLEKKDKVEMDWAKIAFLEDSAEQVLSKAVQIYCQLEKDEGATECKSSLELASWQAYGQKIKAEWQQYLEGKKNRTPPQKAVGNEPVDIAKAIRDQQSTALADHIFQKIGHQMDLDKILTEQKEAFNLASGFLPKVLSWQKMKFSQALKEKKEICFETPWRELFPLAEKGWLAAGQASTLGKENEQQMLWQQWGAWEAWQKVYELLKEAPSSGQSRETQDPSLNKAIKTLEQMAQEERQGKPAEAIRPDSLW